MEENREQRSQNIGRVVYVATEILMSDHSSNAGENGIGNSLRNKWNDPGLGR